MAQPYTARQLDYFRSALTILESAIFPAELPVIEIAEREIVTPAFVSPSEDVVTDSPPVIITPEVSSFVVAPDATHTLLAKTSAADEALQAPAPLPRTAVAIAETIIASAQTEATVTPLKSKTSAVAFFQHLPWQKQASLATVEITDDQAIAAFADNLLAEARLVPASLEVDNLVRVIKFFQSLPWQGAASPVLPTKDFIVNVSSGDFSAIADLATQTAIQAAQRSVKKQEQAPKIASQFFKALPW